MPRPKATTPVENTVLILRGLAQWYGKHLPILQKCIRGVDTREAEGRTLAERLEGTERAFRDERRDDVALTNRRDQAIEHAQLLVRTGIAAAELAFVGDDDVDDVLRDFASIPPSRVRSVPSAIRALSQLGSAFDRHRPRLADSVSHVDQVADDVQTTLTELRNFGDERAGENAETSSIRRERDRAKEQALEYVERAILEAGAAEFCDPAPATELDVIFDTHNPPAPDTTDESPADSDGDGHGEHTE